MDIKRHLMAFFPENPRSLGLNEMTMQFMGEKEETYLSQGRETFLSKKRLGLIIGIVMFAIFGLSDLILAPDNLGILLFIRFGLTAAILFFALSLSYIEKVKPHFAKVIVGAILVMSLSQLLVFTKLPLDVLPKYHFSYLILIVYSSFIMSTNFIYTIGAAFLSLLLYVGYVLFSPAILGGDKLLFALASLALFVIVLIVTYYAEYLSRRSFILENRLMEGEGQPLPAITQAPERPRAQAPVNAPHPTLSNKDRAKLEKELRKELKSTLSAEIKNEAKEELRSELRGELEAEIRLEFDRAFVTKEDDFKKKEAEYKKVEEDYKQKLELEKKNCSMLEKELEDLKMVEYERAQLREEAFLKEKEAILKDKDRGYDEFKQGLLKDYENRLNKLQKELDAREEKRKELEGLNKNLMADLDKTMNENKELKDKERIQIEEKSFDDIKLMGRMGSFASSSMVKNINENMNYFDENQSEFKSGCSLQFLNSTNHRMRENLYIAGAMKYRFDLFRLFLGNKPDRDVKAEVSSSVQRAFSQLSRFFEGTNHYVDVTCKDGIYVRMEDEALDLILQNLVMSSLTSAAKLGESAHIVIDVKEENSKVIIEYEDEGKNYAGYYKEILKLKDVHSNIVSVSGLEIFFIRHLIQRDTGGSVEIDTKASSNKIVMSFIK